jgi:quercetin dioxygenase-like cupin family protein
MAWKPGAKKRPARLAVGALEGQHDVNYQTGANIMAAKRKTRSTVRARAKKPMVRRSAKIAAKGKAKRRPHKFAVSHLRNEDFKSDGLRTYAQYRDLGVKDATNGMAVAHVIRFVGQCDPKVVSKEHLHEADFQMIYVLKGSMTSSFEGHGTHVMKAGDAWLQPHSIKHKVLDYSDDCEVLEIVMPGNFKTVELEK